MVGSPSASLRRAIIVCALGYFIDIFDIQLFAVLRVASLTDLGVSADRLSTVGGYILNAQMFGMISGAFLWGWLGDRFGRLKTLYGSIFVYSLGTLACAFVHDPVTYGVMRFVAGFGLAGETGGAITLIMELMSSQKRGWGAAIIGGFGSFGPVLAIPISWLFEWRTTYIIAGLMGIALLVLRLRLIEPAMFEKIAHAGHGPMRGSLKLLLQPRLALLFLCGILIGVPNMYAVNLLNFFSFELSQQVLVAGQVFDQRTCLLVFYTGLGCGNILWSVVSQLWKNRRKSATACLFSGVILSVILLLLGPTVKFSALMLYAVFFALGCTGGLALVAMIAAEHFGTNIRATGTILITNLMRGSIIPMVFAFQWFKHYTTSAYAAALVGMVVYALAFLALSRLRETHGLDLDYVETMEKSARRA